MTTRPYNFSAGPAMLPEEVLLQVQEECMDWYSGMSIMEVSHRSPEYVALVDVIEQKLRQLLQIPPEYSVLFLPGGARAQFSAVPLNLLGHKQTADYLCTGSWSLQAIAEARRYGKVNIAMSTESNFTYITAPEHWSLSPDAAYVHYTPNETIQGVEFPFIPPVGVVPLVADMSSTLLSKPIDVSRFHLIYACAQKNMGPAGITVVILHPECLHAPAKICPSVLNYQLQAKNKSMYNTPPTFNWYVVGLVLDWLVQQGGLKAMGQRNTRKAEKLYSYIDSTDFYISQVEQSVRSLMNIPFRLAHEELNQTFLQSAAQRNLLNLQGHSQVGGMRASLYNAMPESGVDALISFMDDFSKSYG